MKQLHINNDAIEIMGQTEFTQHKGKLYQLQGNVIIEWVVVAQLSDKRIIVKNENFMALVGLASNIKSTTIFESKLQATYELIDNLFMQYGIPQGVAKEIKSALASSINE